MKKMSIELIFAVFKNGFLADNVYARSPKTVGMAEKSQGSTFWRADLTEAREVEHGLLGSGT
jgi:hypothetical protein